MKSAPSIVIVAGEASGDAHGARVLRALKGMYPDLTAWGFGGDRLAEEGMEIREHVDRLSVMGIWEVLKQYGYFRRVFHQLVSEIRKRKPDLVLLVDYPGFNLRLAAALQGDGIPIVQYVCPQVWAWKKKRIPKMEKVLDGLICIFPFEKAVFEGSPLPVYDCGHPMVEETLNVEADSGWGDGVKLALVPGSRLQEIERIFVPMLETAALVRKELPELQIRVPAANRECKQRMRALRDARPELPAVELIDGHMREVVKGADAALVTSGTATLETALLGTPMLIVYKTSNLTYAIGKRVVTVAYIGMVNLIAKRELCPEFIQDAAEPAVMADSLLPLLRDSRERREMKAGLADVRKQLTSDQGGKRVAEVLSSYLRGESR
ncbi:MAG: lipid-A-disaccharide synthase [Kiritimatiellia bacterium]